MYKRDFGILLLSVCALYLSLQHEGVYQFKKAWYHSFEDHEPAAHELEEHWHPVPPPIVADLNGDGKPELVTATPSGRIQILAPRRFGDGFAQAELIAQTEPEALAPSGDSGAGAVRVAGLTTGYLTPPPRELVRAPRKQVGSSPPRPDRGPAGRQAALHAEPALVEEGRGRGASVLSCMAAPRRSTRLPCWRAGWRYEAGAPANARSARVCSWRRNLLPVPHSPPSRFSRPF
jgi:hypothetical protein